ncbi:MAG: PAS domain S-box protein [Bryobacteraceae bacterium]
MSLLPGAAVPYLYALLAVLVTTAVRIALAPVLEDHSPMLIFTVPVMISAWYGGLPTGIFATVLSVLSGGYFLIEPENSLTWPQMVEQARLAIFTFTSLAISFACDRLRREKKRAEKSQATLSALLEAASQGVVSVDAAGMIVAFNATAERMFGYSREDVLGMPMENLLPRNGRHRAGIDLRARRKDGTEFPVEISLSSVETENGLLTLSFFTDISDLREHQERLRAALAASNTGTFRWHLRTNRLEFDENLNVLFGLPPGETVGRLEDLAGMVHPDDRKDVLWALENCAGEGSEFELKFRVVWRDGSVHWLLKRGKLECDDHGRPLSMTGACAEISELKRAEEDLREAHALLDALFENAPIGLGFWDRDLGFVRANKRLTEIGCFAPGDLTTKQLPEVLAESEGKVRSAVELVLRTGQSVIDQEATAHTPGGSGEERRWLLRYYPVWLDRTIVGAGVVCEDVTERKRSEEEALQTQKLESLGVLAGGIAHDFNNLLVGILGNASLVQDSLRDGDGNRELLDQVVNASERAADLTRQLLAYSGKGQFVIVPVAISHLVREIGSLIRTSLPKKVELRLNLDDDLPAVEADAGQIQQVIMNLVINGAEAIGEASSGYVSVATSLQRMDLEYIRANFPQNDLLPGDYILLEVRDSGAGMDEATQARMFDPFFTTKFTGRGLGLSAVSGIVRGHKGALSVQTAPGEGTIFRVWLPATGSRPDHSREAGELRNLEGSGTILVVDDEQLVLQTAMHTLEHYGYKVLLAENGSVGVDLFSAHRGEIEMVLLDLAMPVMSGDEAFDHLQRIDPNVKVVLTSGFSEVEATRRFAGKTFTGFLQKPYRSSALAEKVHTILV